MLHLRKALPDDIPVLSRLAADTFRQTYGGFDAEADIDAYISEHFQPESLAKALAAPLHHFWLAFGPEAQALGYAKAIAAQSPSQTLSAAKGFQIEKIYVHQEAQGLGIGQALMQQCLAEAQAWAAEYLWLGVWKENHKAIRFYEQCGFRIAGNYRFTMGSTTYEEDYFMLKNLI